MTERTRLLVVSHITSPTAIIFPVQELCQQFRELGVATCVDGPHAPAHVDIDLDEFGCDFYTASCHKWLCAPLGSGFCFAHPRWHDVMQPPLKSWGRMLPAIPESWDEEFTWSGTRDFSQYLSIPVAIDFIQAIGIQQFRERCFWLSRTARQELIRITGCEPIAPESMYGCMAHVPLPAGDHSGLQQQLWQNLGIEVPIIDFEGRWYVRVSCHLYIHMRQIEVLLGAIREYLK